MIQTRFKHSFQIPSLRHLVLLGLFVALIPLSVLLLQNNSMYKNAHHSFLTFTESSFRVVKQATEMESRLTNIERTIRQFRILETEELAELALSEMNRYEKRIIEICTYQNPHLGSFCKTQPINFAIVKDNIKAQSTEVLLLYISRMHEQQSLLNQSLWQYLEDQIQRESEQQEQQQQKVVSWLITIALITTILMFYISGWVTSPVKRLINQINAIAERQATDNQPFSAPPEFQQLLAKLNWLAERLNQLEATRLSFLRHASHELKTPLASIHEGCALLTDEIAGPLTANQKEIAQLIQESTQKMAQQTEQLLDYNRVLQQPGAHWSDSSPEQLINQVIERHQLSISQRQMTLNVNCQVANMRTDAQLFIRIVDNLLSNACAYGNENGTVLIELLNLHGQMELKVANTGATIEKKHWSQLFDPFFRVDIPRHHATSGSGLGLSIVNDCVRMLNGHVDIIDLPEFHFTVKIQLPIC